jgi:hypothetical protein
VQAQCLACASTIEDGQVTYKTEPVNRNGHNFCGCDGGCNCVGSCEFEPEPIPEIETASGFDINSINLTEDGKRLIFDGGIPIEFIANSIQGGVIGNNKMDEIYFMDDIANYALSEYDIIVYPVRNNQFKLKDCFGETMAVVNRPESKS